ncbi:MAG: CDP-diacylglycerol--serine O-phosphatidyltransferase [Opitutales bacterium]
MDPNPEDSIKSFSKYTDPSEASRIYFLPNLFTAGNLFFGFLAIIRCIQAKYDPNPAISKEFYTHAVWLILLACICDALDGRMARIGRQESIFGKEFDSIADVVSFGVAPALMVFFLILSPTDGYPFFRQVGWFIGFIYLLCAGVRLARFNVLTSPLLVGDKDDVKCGDFSGLPVPAAAGVIASLVLVLNRFDLHTWTLALPGLMLLIAWLMTSNIPYPSFKNINWHTRTPLKTFIGIVLLGVLILLLKEISFSIVFLGYVFYGLIRFARRRTKAN